ncbi:MAG: hypothetical protein KGL39_47510 [Patescibacteria group bacterium]|nr:hypothetical protein [Patescibacteria group bacterium]
MKLKFGLALSYQWVAPFNRKQWFKIMKKIVSIMAIAAVFLAAKVNAQTYGAGTTVWGGTNIAAVQSSIGVFQTNIGSVYMPQKTLILANISQTNETVIGTYGFQLPDSWKLLPGSTNIYIVGSFTNSFAGGTNSGSWTTNNIYFSQNIYLPGYFNLDVGDHTNTAFMP